MGGHEVVVRALSPAQPVVPRRRSAAATGSASAADLMRLQRRAGNQAVLDLLARQQATAGRAASRPERKVDHAGPAGEPASAGRMGVGAGTAARTLVRTPASVVTGPVAPINVPRAGDDGDVIRRHSSWEHSLLGDAKPEVLGKMGTWQDLIAKTKTGGDDVGEVNIQGVGKIDKGEVMHVLVQEMTRVKEWQSNPPVAASTDDGTKKTAKDPTFDVIVVRLPGKGNDKSLLVTYGELNTLADFYGDLETMSTADPAKRRQILQSVRKETFLRLKEIYTKLTSSLTRDEKNLGSVKDAKQGFKDAKLGNAKFAGAASVDFISSWKGQADLLAGDKPMVGQGTGAKGDTNTYGATLARNACHFVPESWHAWANYHDKARTKAAESFAYFRQARDCQTELDTKDFGQRPLDQSKVQIKMAIAKSKSATLANEALLNNGFGDHYLQDSYASGHMINKTQIMQWYVEFIDKNDEWDYFKDDNWRKVQMMAYGQNLAGPEQYTKGNVKGATPNNNNESAPRNPQSVESGVAGTWQDRFAALGLQVPASLRTPGSDERAMIEWWQKGVIANAVTAELSGATLVQKGPFGRSETKQAIMALTLDGVVRMKSETLSGRGQYMGASAQEKQGASFNDFSKEVFILRDAYIPKGKDKIQKFKAALAQSEGTHDVPGDDSAYQKMAESVTYGDYLEFMKSGFLQKSTNALHDAFCLNGLTVQSAAGEELFKVYGDDSMFNKESSRGVQHSGATANMSRDSIISIIDTGADGGVTVKSILDRLPSRVQITVNDQTVEEDIADWHNSDQPGRLKDQAMKEIFPSMSGSAMQKLIPGTVGSDLGKISKDEKVHGSDAF